MGAGLMSLPTHGCRYRWVRRRSGRTADSSASVTSNELPSNGVAVSSSVCSRVSSPMHAGSCDEVRARLSSNGSAERGA